MIRAVSPRSYSVVAVLAFSMVLGCAQPEQAREPSAQPPSLAELENLTYSGIYDAPVELSSGRYEGEPFEPGGELRPRLSLVEDSFRTGDFDGDGQEESAVLLSESSGGSGVFTYLALASATDEQVRNVATTELGDRVVVRSMEAKDGAVVMDLVVAGLDDPTCCPTVKVRNAYRLEGERLTVQSEELGRLSADDLGGVTWRLTHWTWGEPVDSEIEITATFAEGRVSGSSGCNQYNASVDAGDGAELRVGQAAVTRMACPEPVDEAEQRYLAAVGNVTQFTFQLGKLVLTYQEGDDYRALVFEPFE